MTRFLAIGECMIELSPTENGGLWRQGIAGDTLNTAWYARARLPADWRVDYATRLGEDRFSAAILGFLAQNGLGTDHISRDPTRGPGLYAISLQGGERSFTYWRNESAARGLGEDRAALDLAMAGAALVFVSGITVAILPPSGRENLLAALNHARHQGALIAFDPNIRPRLWENPDSARHWITRFAAAASIVLPSFDDEAACFGDTQPEATRARYLAAGVSEVVVKNGGGAVLWALAQEQGTMTGLPRVTPIDTTGAGDSFNGAYLAARLQGRPVTAAIAEGHALASRVVGHHGALIPQAELHEQVLDGLH